MKQLAAALRLSAGLTLMASAAMAAHLPDYGAAVVSDHQTDTRADIKQASPFTMNYSDEAAATLGVRNGKWALFDTGRPARAYMPSFKGGVDRDGLKLRLMWNLGR